MTEQEQRKVYEFLRPELKGKDWGVYRGYDGAMAYWSSTGRPLVEVFWRVDLDVELYDLPPLDMNTAFGEAIPKLEAEGVAVSWDGGSWKIYKPQYAGDPKCWTNPAFWPALVEYLEGK